MTTTTPKPLPPPSRMCALDIRCAATAAGALRLARDSFSACKAQLRAVLVATDNQPIE